MINDSTYMGLQQPPTARGSQSAAADIKFSELVGQAAPGSVKPEAGPETQQLQSAVTKLNDFVQNVQRTLSFSIEESSGTAIVQVIDSETDELIRQIPTEETIKLAASIAEFSANLLVNEQA